MTRMRDCRERAGRRLDRGHRNEDKDLIGPEGVLPVEKLCRYRHEPGQLASAAHAHRDLERQLAEGPAPPCRGVPRLRRRRRAVPAGDEVSDTAFPQLQFRASATSRCTTARASGTASRSSRASASTTRRGRLRRRRRRSLRRRRAPRCSPTCGGIQCASVYVPERPARRHRVLRTQARLARRAARLARTPTHHPGRSARSSSATSTSLPKTATSGTRRRSSARPM